MLNTIQSGSQLAPRVAHEGFKQGPSAEAFALSSEPRPERSSGFKLFGSDGFTALDAIDIVNPLQHLPIIGPLYRKFTGDSLDPFSRIAGNTLFFGPFGAAFSSINVAVEEITGKDIGSNVLAILNNGYTKTTEPQIASIKPVNPPKTDIYKNNIIDPVLAWATSEINYRNSEALNQGIDLPTRPYSTLIASTVSNNNHNTQSTVLSTKPKPINQSLRPNEQALGQAQRAKVPDQYESLALNVLKNNSLTSPITAQKIKRLTNAYTSQPSIDQSTKYSTSQAVGPKTNRTKQINSNSTDRIWFLSSINNALSKYHKTQNSNLLNDKNIIPHTSSLR